jgi:hypothetical protein
MGLSIIFCKYFSSGKVYYDAMAQREEFKAEIILNGVDEAKWKSP